MDPRLTYGSLLVPSVPAGAAAAAAVAAGLHHPQHLHPFHSQLTSSVHHLTHPLHPFSQPPSTVSHHLNNNHESSPAGSSTNNNNNSNNRSNHNSNNNSNSNINPVTGKVKRARQRVDAGEPRNSYASITNFSSTRSSAFHHPGKSTTGSGLHTSRSSSGVFKSNSSSSLSSSPPSSSSSSSCLSKSQSSGLSYALSSQPSTCSSCSFCSNNQSHHHHHHHHHHNRSSSSSSSHPHLQSSSSTNSGGSGIGIQCNDKMTSQYKENQINFNKQQNVDNIVASLTSPNSNVILGVRGVGGSGSASGISNNSIINLNNMYHNGQSSQQSTKQFVNNYPEESGKHQQSIISFAKTPTSVPSSPLTSPIPLTNKVDHLFNLASTVSSLTPIKSTNSSPVSNLTSTVSDVYESNQQQQVEIGSGNSSTSPSSAYLLRVILQKGRQVGSNTTNYNQSNNSNQVNCDKIGANCETTRRKGENEEEEKDDNNDQDDEETDSGRTITGSPVNNGEEGGDKVDDEDDNMNNNGNNNEQEDTNDDENEIVTGGVDDDITDEDENVDDDYVKASCSVESEGEPDGGDYSSGRGGSSKPDRYNLDTDEYNNNDIMSLYGESKNHFTSNEKRVTIKSSTDNQVNHDKSDSTTLLSTSTETITCNKNNTDSTPNLPLISDQREQLASSPCSQSSTTITTLTSTPIGSSSSNKANGPTICDVKRARVENIVTNILPRSNSISGQLTRSDEPVELISTIKDQQSSSTSSSSIVNGCKKRKLYHPQQSKSNGSLEDDEDDFLDNEFVNDDDEVEDDDDIIIGSGVNGGRGREEDDEINDSLIGLSSNTIGDYEMSEIKDLSIKSSVKCEVGGDKSDLIYDEMSEVKDLSLKSLVKREIGGGYKSDLDGEMRKVLLSPIIKHEGISTLMAKYETKTDPTSTSISSSNTNTPKDLSKSSVSSSRSNKVSRKDHSHHSSKRHSIGDNLIMKEDDLDGMMADDELVMNDDDLNRESSHHQINLIKSSHHNHLASSHHSGHRRFGGLQDPAQLLNEARKLVYEQEKMTKGSPSSHESHHNSNHHNHHHRQSRSSRKRPYPPVATPSSTPTCTIPNGLRPETLPPNATSSPIYYSDIGWLRDTLKAEMQAHLIHLIRQHQHQYYPLHHHQTPQQQAAVVAAAAAAATAQLDNHHPQPDQLTPQQREDDLRQRHSHLHPLHHLQDQHHQAAQQQAAAATAQLDHNHSQSEQSPHQRDDDVRQRNHHHHPLLHHPAHQQQAAVVAAQQHHHHHQSEQSPQQRDEDVRQRHPHPHLHPLHHLQDQHHQAAQQQAAALAAAAAQQDQHNQAVQKQQADAIAAAAAQQDHHQAATAAAIQNALAVNHFAILAQANRAAGGGDTASPESLSQFGGTRSENGADGSESLNDSTGYDTSTPLMSSCGNLLALQTTLTPMHLRKAKLMFFYVRYPSSNVLKTFFPDIKFNKNNTAQLVKWFSNFREFYYIQMEKYARQAITEGIKNADDIHIHREAELLRVLNMHYNRSNHLDVPERFCFVVEQTLKEFFKSILAGKDNEQSWKKAIYKIISRLDDSVPEYFKSPNFLERLE